MDGRGKSEKAHLSERWKEDRISQLPDPLICQMLSRLPTKEAVQTSVLSSRWTSLWLWVPSLEMISDEFPDFNTFKSFGDRLFESNRVSWIHNLKLSIDCEKDDGIDAFYLTSWIDASIKRKVQYLDVRCNTHHIGYQIPISIYTCESLVCLKLYEVDLVEAGFVSLPCLKTMSLKYVRYPNAATFERLVSCCPVLEKLNVFEYGLKVFRVHSLSLKKLHIELNDDNDRFESVIDAPRLSFLKIDDDDFNGYIIKDLDSNAKLDISLIFGEEFDVSSKRHIIREFLSGISKVGEIIICQDTFKVFHHYSKLETLPQFAYMSHLDAAIYLSDLKGLPTFLDRCPNLISLVLVLDDYDDDIDSEEMDQISFSTVVKCLLSSLKSVDIKSCISGKAAEMKLVRYFLRNSIILEKLTLRLDNAANENVILKKLMKIPRRSITCQVIVR